MLRQPVRSGDLEWQSKADRLIGLASNAGLELFRDPDQQGWASVRVDTHWENYPIRARAFQLFLLRLYYLNTGESPGARAIRAAAELFEARALFDGEECPVHLRVAEHGGRLYLDLCDRAWRAVEIDAEGWRVVDRPPAKFRRTRGARPLPEPEHGGSLEELRPFFNVDHHGWILIRAFLVGALRPGFPLPILLGKGEQAPICLALITPCGFLMGFCFPVGRRWMRELGRDNTLAWMWALNGGLPYLRLSSRVSCRCSSALLCGHSSVLPVTWSEHWRCRGIQPRSCKCAKAVTRHARCR